MKITVYCDKEGILRYNPKGWPNNPSFDLGPKPSGIDYEIMDDLSEAYTTALEKAKSESILFEDQETILFLISESLPGPLIDLLNLTKPDSFYDVEIDGKICVVTEMSEGWQPTYSNPDNIGCEKPSEPIQVARIVKNELSGNSGQLQSDPNGWIKSSDRMPEFNIGVLVFIPEEDHHITAGMWDVSKKWILLDEYRIPQSEVTYWMPMPNEPIDKTYKKSDRVERTTTEIIRELHKENFLLKQQLAK